MPLAEESMLSEDFSMVMPVRHVQCPVVGMAGSHKDILKVRQGLFYFFSRPCAVMTPLHNVQSNKIRGVQLHKHSASIISPLQNSCPCSRAIRPDQGAKCFNSSDLSFYFVVVFFTSVFLCYLPITFNVPKCHSRVQDISFSVVVSF